MGKRERSQKVRTQEMLHPVEEESSDAVKDPTNFEKRCRTNWRPLVRGEPEGKNKFVEDLDAAIKVPKGGDQMNDSSRKACTRQSKKEKNSVNGLSGNLKAKASSWSAAEEIIFLHELAKSANTNGIKNVNWKQLGVTVGQMLDCDLTRIQVYEKARRMKQRYTLMHQKIRRQGKLDSLKTEEEKIYKLSGQIWGTCDTLNLPLEEHDLTGANQERSIDEVEPDELCNAEVYIPKVDMEREKAPKQHRDHASSHPNQLPSQRKEKIMQGEGSQEPHLPSGNLERSTDEVEPDSLCNAEVDIPKADMEREKAPTAYAASLPEILPSARKEKITTGGGQSTECDGDGGVSVRGDTQRMFQEFHAEHQALLKELQKSCETVLEDMQVKLLTLMKSAVREMGASQAPGMEGNRWAYSFDFIPAPVGWDKMFHRCLAPSGPSNEDEPAAFDSLREQWQQQRLQELKLTSLRLQLMLEECKREQDKLEKRVLKS